MGQEKLVLPFAKSVRDMIQQMANIEVGLEGDFHDEHEELISLGVASVISFAGKIKGRLVLDMEPALALAFAGKLNGRNYPSEREVMVLMSVSELNNIVAGDANTYLNNQFHLSLRLAPPVVFAGNQAIIHTPRIPSSSLFCQTQYGKLKVNVGFEGSV
jgi:chemotaxis protein CheX